MGTTERETEWFAPLLLPSDLTATFLKTFRLLMLSDSIVLTELFSNSVYDVFRRQPHLPGFHEHWSSQSERHLIPCSKQLVKRKDLTERRNPAMPTW